MTWSLVGNIKGAIGNTGSSGANGTNGTNGQGVATGGTAGQALTKIDATNFNTTWTTLGGGSGTVTSVAALTLGTTGTDLTSTVANGTTAAVITLNVPSASAANRGVLTAADWSTFNGKQAALVSGTNLKTVGGNSLLGSTDVSVGVTSVGGSGTVSGLTLGGSVTSTGNLTLSGTLAVTASNFASQAQATVLAAPSGSAGLPTFRNLVSADIPTLNQSTTGSAATLTTPRTIASTGDVTYSTSFDGSANVSSAATVSAGAITLAKMANLAANSFIGNNTGAPATPIALTVAQAKALLAIASTDVSGLAPIATSGSATDLASGTVAAARMPAFTGDVTTSAGAVANTIAAGAVSLSKMAALAASSFIGNNTGSAATPIALTIAQAKALLAITTADVSGTVSIASGGTGATTAGGAVSNLNGFATTTTAAGTTTLTVSSPLTQQFTGTTTQTVVLPVTSTLTQGWTYWFNNLSTGTLTVNSSGGNLVCTIGAGQFWGVTCVLTSGTSAASWNASFDGSTLITGSGSNVLSTSPALTNPTITGYTETLYAPAEGSSFTVALSNGTVQKLSLNANGTITLPSSVAGTSYVIIVTYSGAFTVTWAGGGAIKWAGGTAPTPTSVSGKYDIFSFFADGPNTYGSTFGLNF
jgi:hypothetical protein